MKIAFVGASGYGNVGDDTYPILWRRFFPRLETQCFNSNHPVDGLDPDTALVVFGGGGLMWHRDGDAHFEYMSYYVAEAEKLAIPFGMISCDFQFDRAEADSEKFIIDPVVEQWLPLLRRASFIQLRSKHSVDILAGYGICASYAPDLAYLFRPVDILKSTDTITVVPAGRVSANNPEIEQDIQSARSRWPDARLLFLNMGGPIGDEKTHEFSEKYPTATVVLSDRADPVKALDVIGRSHLVLSGRYHGMVFARNCGTPCRTYPGAPYKIDVEPVVAESGDAWQNVLMLREQIRRTATG